MDTYLRECEKLYIKGIMETIQNSVSGFHSIDVKANTCQLDGGFSRVQKNSTHVYCSDSDGNLIESYAVLKTDPLSKRMNCSKYFFLNGKAFLTSSVIIFRLCEI